VRNGRVGRALKVGDAREALASASQCQGVLGGNWGRVAGTLGGGGGRGARCTADTAALRWAASAPGPHGDDRFRGDYQTPFPITVRAVCTTPLDTVAPFGRYAVAPLGLLFWVNMAAAPVPRGISAPLTWRFARGNCQRGALLGSLSPMPFLQ
jgi:hypothetical protein